MAHAAPAGPRRFLSWASVVCIVEDFADPTHAEERNPIVMSIPATMRALQQMSLNGPQDLRLITDAPVPVPGPGEVLIRVAAAGVNFGDISQSPGRTADLRRGHGRAVRADRRRGAHPLPACRLRTGRRP